MDIPNYQYPNVIMYNQHTDTSLTSPNSSYPVQSDVLQTPLKKNVKNRIGGNRQAISVLSSDKSSNESSLVSQFEKQLSITPSSQQLKKAGVLKKTSPSFKSNQPHTLRSSNQIGLQQLETTGGKQKEVIDTLKSTLFDQSKEIQITCRQMTNRKNRNIKNYFPQQQSGILLDKTQHTSNAVTNKQLLDKQFNLQENFFLSSQKSQSHTKLNEKSYEQKIVKKKVRFAEPCQSKDKTSEGVTDYTISAEVNCEDLFSERYLYQKSARQNSVLLPLLNSNRQIIQESYLVDNNEKESEDGRKSLLLKQKIIQHQTFLLQGNGTSSLIDNYKIDLGQKNTIEEDGTFSLFANAVSHIQISEYRDLEVAAQELQGEENNLPLSHSFTSQLQEEIKNNNIEKFIELWDGFLTERKKLFKSSVGFEKVDSPVHVNGFMRMWSEHVENLRDAVAAEKIKNNISVTQRVKVYFRDLDLQVIWDAYQLAVKYMKKADNNLISGLPKELLPKLYSPVYGTKEELAQSIFSIQKK